MSDPFQTDYAGQPTTIIGLKKADVNADRVATLPIERRLDQPASQRKSADFGFEPKIYGTGKPRRVIIRGKISVG